MRDRNDLLGWVVADYAGNPAFSGVWMRWLSMIHIKGRRHTAANDTSMAFDPKQLWQLSILETVGVVTLVLSVILIAGIVLVR